MALSALDPGRPSMRGRRGNAAGRQHVAEPAVEVKKVVGADLFRQAFRQLLELTPKVVLIGLHGLPTRQGGLELGQASLKLRARRVHGHPRRWSQEPMMPADSLFDRSSVAGRTTDPRDAIDPILGSTG